MTGVHSEFSKYDVYTEVSSLYCYKDSHMLRNKYGIRDYQALRKLEQDIVGAKQQYLLEHPIMEAMIESVYDTKRLQRVLEQCITKMIQ